MFSGAIRCDHQGFAAFAVIVVKNYDDPNRGAPQRVFSLADKRRVADETVSLAGPREESSSLHGLRDLPGLGRFAPDRGRHKRSRASLVGSCLHRRQIGRNPPPLVETPRPWGARNVIV